MKSTPRALAQVLFVALAAGSCGMTSASPGSTPTISHASPVLVDELGGHHDVAMHLSNGKSVALVFWQTWCVTCRAEGPALVQAARIFKGKIEFFGVVSGPDEVVQADELQRVTQQLALPYPQIRDRDGSLADRFHVQSTPTIIVLGSGGTELYRGSKLPKNWAALAGS